MYIAPSISHAIQRYVRYTNNDNNGSRFTIIVPYFAHRRQHVPAPWSSTTTTTGGTRAQHELFELLERVQCSRLDDQRAVLPPYFSQVSHKTNAPTNLSQLSVFVDAVDVGVVEWNLLKKQLCSAISCLCCTLLHQRAAHGQLTRERILL